MGLDQYVYAETGRLRWRKQACVAYWRKNYDLAHWVDSRLTDDERRAYEASPCAFSHRITASDLAELGAKDNALARRLGVDYHELWAMVQAMKEGFRLHYFSSS